MTVIQTQSPLSQILRPVIETAQKYASDRQEKLKRQELVENYNKWTQTEGYKNASISERASLTNLMFGPEAAKSYVEGQKAAQEKGIDISPILSQSDFSTPEGQKAAYSKLVNSGLKPNEALSLINEFKPSDAEQLLKYIPGYGGQAEQPAQAQPQGRPTSPLGMALGGQPGQAEAEKYLLAPQQAPVKQQQAPPSYTRPGVKATPLAAAPESALLAASASKDRSTSELAKAEIALREKNEKAFQAERKFQTGQAKKYSDSMTEMRKTLASRENSVNSIDWAIKNRDTSVMRKDWWANQLGSWGEGMISPEGAVLNSAVKFHMIDSLSSVSGRPNMFLEQRIVGALPGIGKKPEANEAINIGEERKVLIDKKQLELYDQIADKQEKELGSVQGNIERIVSKELEPYAKDITEKAAYKMRQVQEKYDGIEKLSKKKVMPGTYLTVEMAKHLKDKHKDVKKAKEVAKKLGYLIPTAEQVRRWTK